MYLDAVHFLFHFTSVVTVYLTFTSPMHCQLSFPYIFLSSSVRDDMRHMCSGSARFMSSISLSSFASCLIPFASCLILPAALHTCLLNFFSARLRVYTCLDGNV
ncbi:hypothetical protein ABW21_db0208449 [Orbilia brochopaga]|nr:hypothetical protein ABW21_db0208449 [Drechslerella brochopaga]